MASASARPFRRPIPVLAAVALLCALGAGTASAGVNRWTPVGPGGGTIRSVLAPPDSPGTLYALTPSQGSYGSGEVYKSADDGESWEWWSPGLPYLGLYLCQSLALSPSRPSTLFASVGPHVYRRTADAASWAAVGATGLPTAQTFSLDLPCALALAPGRPNAPDVLFFSYGPQLLKSVDLGESWIPVFRAPADLQALLVNPSAPDVVYVGTTRGGGGFWRSTDGGDTFTRLGDFDEVSLLAAPPSGPPGLLYATSGGMLYASIDGGVLWRLRSALPAAKVYALSVEPASPRFLLAGQDHGLSRSRDGGETWEDASGGLPRLSPEHYAPGTIAVHALAAAPGAGGAWYVGTEVLGVFRTRDFGDTWSAGTQHGLSTGSFEMFAHPAIPDLFYGLDTVRRVWRSADGGRSWELRSSGGQSPGFYMTSLACDPLAPDTLVAASPSSGVYRSVDGGATWEHIGLSAASTVVVADGTTFVALGPDGLMRTADGGKTWSPIRLSPDNPYGVWPLVADPVRPAILYAMQDSGSVDHVVFRSQDKGLTWSRLVEGPAFIAVSRSHPQTLYGISGGSYPNRVYRSDDDGAHWAIVGRLPDGTFSQAVVDAQDPLRLYTTALPDWLFQSTDGGATWTKFEAPLPRTAPFLFQLSGHPTAPRTIYTNTWAGGFYQLEIEP